VKDKNFRLAKTRKEFLFKSYSKKNLARLQELAGKFIKVKKVSDFFYQIQREDTLIFRGDFRYFDTDEPFKSKPKS